MNSKQLPLMSILLIFVLASLSCSLFFSPAQPTQPPEPYFGPTGGPLKIEPEVLPNAQKGVKYEAQIHISQNITPAGDISVSNGSLPPGVEFVFWMEKMRQK